jgi:hypothetical protein
MELLPQLYLHTYKHTADQNSNKIPKIQTVGQRKSGNRRLNVHGTLNCLLEAQGRTLCDVLESEAFAACSFDACPGLEAEKDGPRFARKAAQNGG